MTLGDIADTLGDRSGQDALLADTAALLERHPDDRRQAELLFSMALLADRRGDAGASEPLARQSFETAERCGAARWAAMAQAQLGWLHLARHEHSAASHHIEMGLQWAGHVQGDRERSAMEAKLLTLAGMVSINLGRFDDARSAFTAMMARGETLGEPRLQLAALDNLALIANYLGRWEETVAFGERMRSLGLLVGDSRRVAHGQLRLAEAAAATGDPDAAISWHEQSLVLFRVVEDRRLQAITLRSLGGLRLQRGDVQVALTCLSEAMVLHRSLTEAVEACEVAAHAARCELLLGRPDVARSAMNVLLERITDDLAAYPAFETFSVRWTCQQVLAALGDARAGPMLEQLHADIQARATELTNDTDRERLIQALPVFRAVVAAHRQHGEPTAPS